jgi:hypothetical protein
MKDLPVVLLATLAVLYSLAMLLLVDRTPYSALPNHQDRISEVGLRFAFKR